MKSPPAASIRSAKFFLIAAIVPGVLVLATLALWRDNFETIFLFGVIGISSFVSGFWLAFRRYRNAWGRLVGGLLLSGLIMIINDFFVFTGCMSPHTEWRRNGASRKEMAIVSKNIPARDSRARPEMVDLSPYYNAPLTEEWHTQFSAQTISSVPIGIQTFAGVDFDVRGVIRTCSHTLRDDGRKFPPLIHGIKIGRRCERIYFLHGSGWFAPDQAAIGSYRIEYSDGQTAEVLINYGLDVLQSWCLESVPNEAENQFVAKGGVVAWKGQANKDTRKPRARLFLTTWENSRPEVEVAHIDLAANDKLFAVPFLVAISLK